MKGIRGLSSHCYRDHSRPFSSCWPSCCQTCCWISPFLFWVRAWRLSFRAQVSCVWDVIREVRLVVCVLGSFVRHRQFGIRFRDSRDFVKTGRRERVRSRTGACQREGGTTALRGASVGRCSEGRGDSGRGIGVVVLWATVGATHDAIAHWCYFV